MAPNILLVMADQLTFDLQDDPGEVRDLAHDPAARPVLDGMLALVRESWDLTALHRHVVESQTVRKFLASALAKGRVRPWEHYPDAVRDHSRFVRRGDDFPDVERRSYLPYGN